MIEMAPAPQEITPEAYLAAELTADTRSEYVGGQVLPMPGVSAVHDRICRNLDHALESFLADHPCTVHGPDLKLKLYEGNSYFYPDLMVCCDPADNATYWRERPRYLFEISSPETKRHDDETKAIAYWHLSSVEAYVQVWQDGLQIAVHGRAAGRGWWDTVKLTEPADELRLEGLGFVTTLAQVYRRTGLLPSPA
ncbi:MAG: Uma2 family endonuclease [Fimbriimonadaceae bacterium]|nr:Uma2 family endonuclease [Fimbriimonadaceae bacterium]